MGTSIYTRGGALALQTLLKCDTTTTKVLFQRIYNLLNDTAEWEIYTIFQLWVSDMNTDTEYLNT